jgi:regulator of protease activity HflC (stomatin/prohibitin superfamily)
MKKNLKTIFQIGTWTFGIAGFVLLLNLGLSLLNVADDWAVFAGYLLLVALGSTLVCVAIKVCRRVGLLLAILGISVISPGCYSTIGPGHVGIKVEQTGHQRGVQDFPAQTGRVWYNPINEDVLDFNTSIIQYTWTRSADEGKQANEEMCFKSSDFMMFCADVNAAFKVQEDKAPFFYVKFRDADTDKFIHGFFRNVIRDSFTKFAAGYTTDQLNGSGQDEMLGKVFEASKSELDTYGVQLIKLGFAHPPRPPEAITQAINNKLAAVQRAIQAENELRQAEAEAKKQIAAAEGKAKSNQIEMSSLTPQLLQMRALEKWDGHLPQVNGGGALPFINIGK